MQYLTRESSIQAIGNITALFDDIRGTYSRHGIDLGNDVGRQNILLSAAQEHFFARAIASVVGQCTNDGRTGAADILIDSLDNREVECKVLSKSKTGAWQFQADKASLERKGSTDFLYLMFNREYTEVGVFLFESLIPDDFKDPSPGSRGKSRLNKQTAFKKCTPIIGSFNDKRIFYMKKYENQLKNAKTKHAKEKAAQKIELWYNKPSCYSIQLESLNEIKNKRRI